MMMPGLIVLTRAPRFPHLSPGYMQNVAGKLDTWPSRVSCQNRREEIGYPDAAALLSGGWVPQKFVMSPSLVGEIRNSFANTLYFRRATSMSRDSSLSVPRSKRRMLPNKHTCQHTGK